jgi:hypothetical protein
MIQHLSHQAWSGHTYRNSLSLICHSTSVPSEKSIWLWLCEEYEWGVFQHTNTDEVKLEIRILHTEEVCIYSFIFYFIVNKPNFTLYTFSMFLIKQDMIQNNFCGVQHHFE